MRYFFRVVCVLFVAEVWLLPLFALGSSADAPFQYPEERFEDLLQLGNSYNAKGLYAMPTAEERVYIAALYTAKLQELVDAGYDRFDHAPCEPSGERLQIADDMLLSAYFYSYAAWRYLADDSINYEHLTQGAGNTPRRVGFLDGMFIGFTVARNIYLDNCEHGPATHADNAARFIEAYEKWIECLGSSCEFKKDDPQTEEHLVVLGHVLNLVADHGLIALWQTGRFEDFVQEMLPHVAPEDLDSVLNGRRLELMGEDDDDDCVRDEL